MFFRRLKRTRKPSDILISGNTKDITPEDVFFDVSSSLPEGPNENKLELPLNRWVTRIFFSSVFLLIAILGVYTTYLSVDKGEEYSLLAQQNSRRLFNIGPSRGQILSHDGKLLAESYSAFNISVNPSELEEKDVEYLSTAFSDGIDFFSYEYVYNKINSARLKNLGSIVLVKNLDQEEVEELGDIYDHPAVYLEERPIRSYPEGNVFSHIIGYTAAITDEELKDLPEYNLNDNIGKKGIEYSLEDVLKGEKGLFAKFVSSRNDVTKEAILSSGEDGSSLRLTIDADLQEASHRILTDALAEYNVDGGAVIVIDPSTGAIKSMVSLPDFDPNHFAKGLTNKQADVYFNHPAKPLFNRVTAGEYASGSVIKPIIAAAALEEGIIDPNKYLFTYGYITVPSVYDPSIEYRFNDWKNHGAVDMREAIAVSSNVYFYTIGGGYENQDGLGINKITEWLSEFGWGKKLGINFAIENEGRVPTPEWKRSFKGERWTIGDTYNTSIGQGDILSTPLQVVSSISVFANGGTLYRPYVIEEVFSGDNILSKNNQGEVLNSNFLSSRTLSVVRDGMRRAVTSGSSRYLLQLPVTSAGKTGTAQTSGDVPNAWFAGFAPYENPEVAIVVLLEEGETSNNAVRVAHDILDHYFTRGSEEESQESL
ncbi:MAG: penicillin-binding protein 2 [Candidatus Spechtbacterales bacterium]|nr:penicillin-binding protein 2 [Candidatus Spechtbacterales bacterium]